MPTPWALKTHLLDAQSRAINPHTKVTKQRFTGTSTKREDSQSKGQTKPGTLQTHFINRLRIKRNLIEKRHASIHKLSQQPCEWKDSLNGASLAVMSVVCWQERDSEREEGLQRKVREEIVKALRLFSSFDGEVSAVAKALSFVSLYTKNSSLRTGYSSQTVATTSGRCGMFCILHLFILYFFKFLMQGQREENRTSCCISCQC